MIIAIISFPGCNRQKTLSTRPWVSVGGEFDSVAKELEWKFNDFSHYDSILTYIERLEMLTTSESELYNLQRARILYWKSKLLWRVEKHDSSLILAKDALRFIDSITYRYDYLRLVCLIYSQTDTMSIAVKYGFYEGCLKYAKKYGDKAFEAYTSILIGNLMGNIGEYTKALHYLLTADSLNRILGYDKLVAKNKINEARVFCNKGNKNVSDSILKSLIGNPLLYGDTFAMNLIPRNLYASSNEISYLYQANDQIKKSKSFRHLRALYSALLLKHNYAENNIDSVFYYGNLICEDLPYVIDYNHKAIVWQALSLAWTLTDRLDSAYICRIRFENYVDSVQIQRSATEVLRLSALHEMGAREAEYRAADFRKNMIGAFIIFGVITSGVMVALLLNRRHMRQKMRAMANELELEKAKRKMAATALSIEEKDKVLDTLRNELSDMRKEGDIKEGNARRLESTIKSHLLEHDNEETFREMFDTVNPGFTEKLRELSPGIADSYVKLASYILMELDNKRIASLMMIKPESVRQSRWRLSQRLNVPEGETLESYLRNLNKSCGIDPQKLK